jgi:hypothetical protein
MTVNFQESSSLSSSENSLDENLFVLQLDEAIATRIRARTAKDKKYPESVALIGGIYQNNGEPFMPSVLMRGNQIFQSPRMLLNLDNISLSQDHYQFGVYGGIIFKHYGHFLLETLSRYWYLKDYDGDIFFHVSPRTPKFYQEFPVWQKEILEILFKNISRIKIISKITRFDKLLIPSPGFIIRKYCAIQQSEALKTFSKRVILLDNHKPIMTEKIWLSRSSLNKGLIVGESEFEECLKKEDFLIVQPEKLSITEQVRLYNQAKLICGFAGSAFHTLILMNDLKAKIIHFARENIINNNYKVIAQAKNLNAEFVEEFFVSYSISSLGEKDVIHDFNGIWQFLLKQGYVSNQFYQDKDFDIKSANHRLIPTNNSSIFTNVQKVTSQNEKLLSSKQILIMKKSESRRSQVVNQIINSIETKNYLEIGVNRGTTFKSVQAPLKVAVDPKFLFSDKQSKILKTGERLEFYEITSDQFFQNHAHIYPPFDLVFIDGLHTFEQTLRDLLNVIHHTHDQSVIIIDDTIPNDVFASLPSAKQCFQLRNQLDIKNGQWMGDVYKLVPFIHDFMPFLSYVTLQENHGQTVVWKERRYNMTPNFKNMSDIAQLSYTEFLMVKDNIFNFATLDQFTDMIKYRLSKNTNQ